MKYYCYKRPLVVIVFIAFLLMFSSPIIKGVTSKQQTAFNKILKSYVFVNDFNIKDEERPISNTHPFWKYPFKISQYKFPIFYEITDMQNEWPSTEGEGIEIQHLNFARVAFIEKNYQKAKNILLSAKARFGKKHPYIRRLNYLIGLVFLKLAQETQNSQDKNKEYTLKALHANAATFLSSALIVEQAQDPLIDKIYPKQIYNLSAIYYNYSRYAAAYGTADKGLNFLRKTAREDYRPLLRKILAEAHIQNRSYLDAAKEFDLMIRQEQDPEVAATAFARMGDIYFDLNNYELAEEQYNFANQINEEIGKINPMYFVLRGESLFWLARFSDSQKMFTYALEALPFKETSDELNNEISAYVQLRIADNYLALNNFEKAKLEYFKITQDFPNTPMANIAQIRLSCLELDEIDKNNIKHTKNILKKLKDTTELPPKAQELAWTCEALLYATKEKSQTMIKKIQAFYEKYPNSPLIKKLSEPVKALQAEKINDYFKSNDIYAAISFFEKTRKLLFENISQDLQIKLFEAYADTYQPQKAQEFWDSYFKYQLSSKNNTLALIRLAAIASEMFDTTTNNKPEHLKWQKRINQIAQILNKQNINITNNNLTLAYFNRLKSTTSITQNFQWLYNLTQNWSNNNKQYICSLMYPLLHTYFNEHQSKMNAYQIVDLQQKVFSIINKNIDELININETCAISFLDMELKLLNDDPALLYKRYEARLNWKLTPNLASVFWLVSQKLDQYDYKTEAKKICELILKSTSTDVIEHILAQIYLNKI